MLAATLLLVPALVVASGHDLAGLVPRQTQSSSGAFSTADPCYASLTSVYASEPTIPPEFLSWSSSVFATITDNCTDIAITGTVSEIWMSYLSTIELWSESHRSELKSLTSVCTSFFASELSRIKASDSSYRSSCRSQQSATQHQTITGSTSAATTKSSNSTTASTTAVTVTTTNSPTSTAAANSLMSSQGSFGVGIVSCLMAIFGLVNLI